MLIVGTLPGTKSLKENQYYADPKNHFWRIIYGIFENDLIDSYTERCAYITGHNLAFWDVLNHADRKGALDKDIKKAEAIENWNQIPLKEHMDKYLKNGMEKKEAMKQVAADRGISKRDVYNELLKDV